MKKIDKNAIINRLRQLRLQHAGPRGKSQFARALGLTPSTYSYYENNRLPPIETLLKVCEVTAADLQWLLTGKDSGKGPSFTANKALLEKIETLLRDSPQLTKPIEAFVDILAEKNAFEKKLRGPVSVKNATRGSDDSSQEHFSDDSKHTPALPDWIPVLGRTAAGMIHFWNQTNLPDRNQAVTQLDELVRKYIGKDILGSTEGLMSIDLQAQPIVEAIDSLHANLIQVAAPQGDDIVEFVEVSQIHQLFPDCFALQIDGDSMSPRINDGDIVIVSPSVPAAQGQVAIACLANQIGVTCKLIRTTETDVHLIPINERYDTKLLPKADLLWALAVLCHISL
jgi:SOS-response transcriptional repressor LexA/DNA-binding XRE family transcriptional regulator